METYVRESNLIEGINDPKFDKQAMIAWNCISKKPDLSYRDICKIQQLITLKQTDLTEDERGHTRGHTKTNVTVGGYACPSWWIVDDLLRNWVLDMDEYWKTVDPIEMHIRFEKIHPFVDGNGRTGRMLLWHHEIRLGKKPTLFWADSKYNEYYPLFEDKEDEKKYLRLD